MVFNTSMTGYQEILTDPSYAGQIVCMTYPEIGNVGVNPEDEESHGVFLRGFVVRDHVQTPSNWRAVESLHAYLVRHGVPGITDIDTRALVRRLRSGGMLRRDSATRSRAGCATESRRCCRSKLFRRVSPRMLP